MKIVNKGQHGGVVDDSVLVAGEAVGEDVARPQVLGDLGQQRRSLADVDHERQVDVVGQLARQLQRADAGAAGGVLVDARLDAEDDVAVLVDHLRRERHVAIVEIRQLPGRPDQANRGDVEQRKGANLVGLDHVAAEAGEVVGAGAADVEPGGDAGAGGDRIGVDAPVGRAPVDVGVEIDQARRDVLTAGVMHLRGCRLVDAGFDGGDLSILDGDVELARIPGTRIDHFAARNQQIVCWRAATLSVRHAPSLENLLQRAPRLAVRDCTGIGRIEEQGAGARSRELGTDGFTVLKHGRKVAAARGPSCVGMTEKELHSINLEQRTTVRHPERERRTSCRSNLRPCPQATFRRPYLLSPYSHLLVSRIARSPGQC